MPINEDEVLREIVGNLESAYFPGDDGGSCDPMSGRFFQLGDAVPLDSLPVIVSVDKGGEGVVGRFGSFDGVSETVGQALVDLATGDDCVAWFDGARRWCIPERVWSAGSPRLFADTDCTQPVSDAYAPLPFAARLGAQEQRCISNWSFYEVEFRGGTVYRRANGECVVEENAGGYIYTLGALLEPESVLHELFLEDAAPPG